VNAGLNDRVEFVFPEASVVNPQHPATINHYFPTAHLVYNTVLSALARINPKRAVAPSGLGSGAVTIGYRKARYGKPAVLYELLETSLGGTSSHDGVAVVMAMNHFTPGAPVEIVESEYPLRVRAFELICDSAGAGTFRGALAMRANSRCWRTVCLPCVHRITRLARRVCTAAARPVCRTSLSIRTAPIQNNWAPLRRVLWPPVTSFVSSAAAEPGSVIPCCARGRLSPMTCETATLVGRQR